MESRAWRPKVDVPCSFGCRKEADDDDEDDDDDDDDDDDEEDMVLSLPLLIESDDMTTSGCMLPSALVRSCSCTDDDVDVDDDSAASQTSSAILRCKADKRT